FLSKQANKICEFPPGDKFHHCRDDEKSPDVLARPGIKPQQIGFHARLAAVNKQGSTCGTQPTQRSDSPPSTIM
ncbi:hypothetical protein ACSTJA_24405, partial [Vibrio parahaemolyticus]